MADLRFAGAVGAASVLTFAVALLRFDGPAAGYWDTYITAPAMFMTGAPIDFVLKDGAKAWDFELSGVLPDDLVGEGSYGIITKDQRIGAPIAAAPLLALLGIFGLRMLFALSVALVVPLGVLAVQAVLPNTRWAALAGSSLLAWNPFVLAIERLNANLIALPLSLLLIAVLFRRSGGAVGLVLGVLAGIREEAICFVPAILFVVWSSWPRPAIQLAKIAGITLLVLLPVFYWKQFAFGHPLIHPSQYAHFEGFRPEFEHSLLGFSFRFNGLFNWPLHDRLVRTPHFAFPTYLLFPLVTLRALGVAGAALALIGAALLARRREGIALLAWMVPVYLLFGPQENWEEVKMTFMLLAWPPIALFFSAGLSWVAGRPRGIASWLAVCAALFAAVKLCTLIDAPADERWYVRFPNARGGAELAEAERNEWRYFQSEETAAELARERAKLTAALPWPATYLPLSWDFRREAVEIAGEIGRRELTVLEIWGYIYGTRR